MVAQQYSSRYGNRRVNGAQNQAAATGTAQRTNTPGLFGIYMSENGPMIIGTDLDGKSQRKVVTWEKVFALIEARDESQDTDAYTRYGGGTETQRPDPALRIVVGPRTFMLTANLGLANLIGQQKRTRRAESDLPWLDSVVKSAAKASSAKPATAKAKGKAKAEADADPDKPF